MAVGPARRIRVVHLALTLNIGGLERFVLDLIGRRNAGQFSASVLCLEEVGTLGGRFASEGIAIEALGWKRKNKLVKYSSLLTALRRLAPDVLHTHNPIPHFYGALAARALRIPVVIHTKHGRNDPQVRKVNVMSGLAGRLSNHVVGVSDDAADFAIRIDRIPKSRVMVIRNGTDLRHFPFAAHCPVDPRAARAICVARLDPLKDHATLLRAARGVADRHPGFVLDIVGDGPERIALEALAHTLSLEPIVTFHGFSHDVAAMLARADVFVLTSLTEGVSLTLLEAMGVGLPVVATTVGGNPEVVVDGETGLLVPPGSPEAVTEALCRVIEGHDMGPDMGRAGRRRVETEFDLDVVVRKYEALYVSALHGRANPRRASGPDVGVS